MATLVKRVRSAIAERDLQALEHLVRRGAGITHGHLVFRFKSGRVSGSPRLRDSNGNDIEQEELPSVPLEILRANELCLRQIRKLSMSTEWDGGDVEVDLDIYLRRFVNVVVTHPDGRDSTFNISSQGDLIRS